MLRRFAHVVQLLPLSRPVLAALAALAALSIAACGNDDDLANDGTSGDEAAAANLGPLRLAGAVPSEFARPVRGGCLTGADSCETRGDCEAAPIDCGSADDRLRITAHWASSDDIDLYVSDRLGDTISFLRPSSLTGGRLIVPEGRSCRPGSTSGEEAASWSGSEVALGTYTVALQHFGSCMSGLGTVQVDLTVSAGGLHLATYRIELAPQERVDMVVLDVAEPATP